MKTGKVIYAIEYVQQPESEISPLYLKLAKLNLPVEETVCFNGEQSVETSITDVFGIRLAQIKLRKKTNKDTFRYVEIQSHFSCWFEMEELRPANTEKVFLKVTRIPNEKKTVLGYRCQKAVIEEEHSTITVWYTNEISVDDPTGAVIHHDSIPGLILEMEESLGSEMALVKRTRVTSIELDVHEPNVFDLPKDAVHVKNIDEAARKNHQALIRKLEKDQKAHALSDSEKQSFEGKWVLSYRTDQIVLDISKNSDGKTYTIQETIVSKNEPEEKQSYKAAFYGETLFVDLSPTFLCYRITENGDLKLERGDFFVFKKQS